MEMECSSGLDENAFATLLHAKVPTFEREPRLFGQVENAIPNNGSSRKGHWVAQKDTTERHAGSTTFTVPGQLTLSGAVEEYMETAGLKSNRSSTKEHGSTGGQTVSTASIVQRQLTLSERVDEFMKNHSFTRHDSLAGQKRSSEGRGGNSCEIPLTAVLSELDMGFSSNLAKEAVTDVGQVSPKRRRSLGHSDITVKGLDQDEDSVDRLDSPTKLPNGNYKCSHLCRNREKLDSLVVNMLTAP
jgi:hypothetical protein